jgi:hypothetical protein
MTVAEKRRISMSKKSNPTIQITREAIEAGEPLEVRKIRQLREQSKRAVSILTAIFWVGLFVFNVALWIPLPIAVSKPVLYIVAFVALIVTIAPIMSLRKHKMCLEYLKVNKDSLKKKTANQAGRVYIDKVKKRDRPFINAEYELLYGSKWSDD